MLHTVRRWKVRMTSWYLCCSSLFLHISQFSLATAHAFLHHDFVSCFALALPVKYLQHHFWLTLIPGRSIHDSPAEVGKRITCQRQLGFPFHVNPVTLILPCSEKYTVEIGTYPKFHCEYILGASWVALRDPDSIPTVSNVVWQGFEDDVQWVVHRT